MATKTFWHYDVSVNGYGKLDEGTAPAIATTLSKASWNVKGLTGLGFEDDQIVYGSTVSMLDGDSSPAGAPNGSNGFRSLNTLNGTFAAGAWQLNVELIGAGSNTAVSIAFTFRLYRSANASGTGATQLTAAAVTTGGVQYKLTTATVTGNTPSIGPFTFSNEYLFATVGWNVTDTTTDATGTSTIQVGGTNVVTPNFTPFDPATFPYTTLPESFLRARWNPERSDSARAGWVQSLWAVPPRKIPEPVLPERFAYPPWNPEKTDVERPASIQSTWAIPPAWKPAPVLPEAPARRIWDPERTHIWRAGWTQALWAIPPAWKPAPVLPETYARPSWNPERSGVFWNSRLIIPVPAWGYEMLGSQRFPAWNPERSLAVAITYLPPAWPTTVVLPERFARTAWGPERSHSVGVPYLSPTWPTTVVAPEWFARPKWNPERTEAARAGWTQALWAVAPQKIPDPVLPEWFARPKWNPERTHGVGVLFIIPPIGISVVAPERFPHSDLRERTAVLVPPFIVQVPLLSWTPALLDRYVQALRSNPWLDFFFPPQIPAARSQLVVLVGRQDATAAGGQQDAISLLGRRDLPTVQGFQDMTTLFGLQAMTAFRGQQEPIQIPARLAPAGLAGSQDAPTTVVSSQPPIALPGQQDAITILGRVDTGPLSGSQ